jgi:hypothetical protein
MADIAAAVRTYLLTQSTVTDVCGTRVSFDVLPQNVTLPAVVVSVVDTEANNHMSSGSQIARSTVEIESYATTRTAANNLAEQIRLVLQHYEGAAGSVTIVGATLRDERDDRDPPVDGSQVFRRIRSQDYEIWYAHAAPSV